MVLLDLDPCLALPVVVVCVESAFVCAFFSFAVVLLEVCACWGFFNQFMLILI